MFNGIKEFSLMQIALDRGTGRGMQTLEAGSKVSKDISGHVTAFVCILYY